MSIVGERWKDVGGLDHLGGMYLSLSTARRDPWIFGLAFRLDAERLRTQYLGSGKDADGLVGWSCGHWWSNT
jgi:hypothetical protein